MEGALMAAKDETKNDADSRGPEAPDQVEGGEETGMKALTEDVHQRREKAKLGGGEEKIALQHERGKLTARERSTCSATRAPSSRSASTDGLISPSGRWGARTRRPMA